MKVILVHGFNKSSRDMKVLAQYLTAMGYECYVEDLPITYKEIHFGVEKLQEFLEKIVSNHLRKGEKINLIGHSTGGLIIRKFISESKYTDYISRCVQIATPNQGSKLATLACKIKPYSSIYRTLKSLHYDQVKKMKFLDPNHIEIGAIAGNKNNLFLGNFIGEKNDGRVEVNSVYYHGLKDFILLPYGHKDIHYQEETARYVHQFLQNGFFS